MIKNVIRIILMTIVAPKILIYLSQYFSIFMKVQLPDLLVIYENKDISDQCQIIESSELNHCEDVVIVDDDDDDDLNPILATCDNRFNYNTVLGVFENGNLSGSLQLVNPYVDLNNKIDGTVIKVDIENVENDYNFHPLGLDVSPKNNKRIFIVNHAVEGSKIDIFNMDYDLGKAFKVKSIQHPLIISPNSISVINDNMFYVSNDHLFNLRDQSLKGKILNWIETFLRLPLGNVLLVKFNENNDELDVNYAANFIPYANGLVRVNEDLLAVASTNTNQVRLYQINKENHELSKLRSVHVPFHVDNLSINPKKPNTIIASGHPHFPTLSTYIKSKGKSQPPPSWSVEIKIGEKEVDVENLNDKGVIAQRRLLKGNKYDSLSTILQSNGNYINSITKLELNDNHFIGGGLYMNGLITCKI